jgi:hypothetical protein
MVSSVTSTSTFGIPVFSDIWLTRSAFLMLMNLIRFINLLRAEQQSRECS